MKAWVKAPDGRYYILPSGFPSQVLTRFEDGEVGFDFRLFEEAPHVTDMSKWGNSGPYMEAWCYKPKLLNYDRKNRRIVISWGALK